MKNKFVYISQKNLDKLMSWAESQERMGDDCDPLACVYLMACSALGIARMEIEKNVPLDPWIRGANRGTLWASLVSSETILEQARDTIGRLALKRMKGSP